MWTSSFPARRPSVTTGGCSRNSTVSGIAPCETAPASARCSSHACPYGVNPGMCITYAPLTPANLATCRRHTEQRMQRLRALRCDVERARVAADAGAPQRAHAARRRDGRERLAGAGDVGAGEPEVPVASGAVDGEEAALDEAAQMLAGGRRAHTGSPRELAGRQRTPVVEGR